MTIANSRREFLRGAAGALAAVGVLSRQVAVAATRRLKMDLHTGNIGVKADLRQQIDYAAKYGFDAFDPNANELVSRSDADLKRAMDDMAARNVEFGFLAQSVPVTRTDAEFAEWLKTDLTGWAMAMQRAKMTRFCTWISPSSRNLTYMQNFELHARRIAEVADVFGDHGVSLGLEYIAPRTSWVRGKYPFIHTMAEMKDLIAETGKDNVGFLIDSWHWHNASETPEDILTLTNKDVVGVHLNDAPKSVATDELIDNQREIPMATGVIDTAGFVNALNQIGYDGPIAAEPLGASIRELPPDEAVAKIAEVMKQALALIK